MCTCARVHDKNSMHWEKGEPITRYEIQRLVLDRHHPDWDKGRESITTGSGESPTTTTTTGSNSGEDNASTANPTTVSITTATTVTGSESSPSPQTLRKGGGQGEADASDKAAGSGIPGEEPGFAAAQEAGAALPSVLVGSSGAGSGSGHGMGEDRKQIGVWIGQRTDKMAPYHTAAGLPTYCRCDPGVSARQTRSRSGSQFR